MSGASERANGRVSGPVLTSLFLFVPDHCAMGKIVLSVWLLSYFGCVGAKGNGDHNFRNDSVACQCVSASCL